MFAIYPMIELFTFGPDASAWQKVCSQVRPRAVRSSEKNSDLTLEANTT